MAMRPVGDKVPATQKVSLDKEFEQLRMVVESAYDNAVTIDEAEKLASRFLSVQLKIAEKLSSLDLDSRMRKSGVKAKRAEVYQSECSKYEKKPSDSVLEAAIEVNPEVREEQKLFDEADSRKESLETYLGIFKDAHIFFRGIAKGRFE